MIEIVTLLQVFYNNTLSLHPKILSTMSVQSTLVLAETLSSCAFYLSSLIYKLAVLH